MRRLAPLPVLSPGGLFLNRASRVAGFLRIPAKLTHIPGRFFSLTLDNSPGVMTAAKTPGTSEVARKAVQARWAEAKVKKG